MAHDPTCTGIDYRGCTVAIAGGASDVLLRVSVTLPDRAYRFLISNQHFGRPCAIEHAISVIKAWIDATLDRDDGGV